MQTSNPFELILNKLEQIQTTVDTLSVNSPGQSPSEPTDPNRIIDLPEAARILCKPVGTVRGYIHSRNLPGRLVGKSYLIKYQELIKWFESYTRGHSMKGKITSGQLVTVEPVGDRKLKLDDIVLCKVNGSQYLHLIQAIQGNRYQIGNNIGRINGWITQTGIFGICINVEN